MFRKKKSKDSRNVSLETAKGIIHACTRIRASHGHINTLRPAIAEIIILAETIIADQG